MYKSHQFSSSLHWKIEARSQRECTSDTEEQLHCLFVLAEVYLGCISTFFCRQLEKYQKILKKTREYKVVDFNLQESIWIAYLYFSARIDVGVWRHVSDFGLGSLQVENAEM